ALGFARSEGGEHGGGGGLISLDKSLIIQMLNFLILLAILYRLLYKPLIAKMEERSAAIKTSLEAAEAARAAAAKQQEENAERLRAAYAEAQSIRAAALKEAADEQRKLVDAARREAQHGLARERGQAEAVGAELAQAVDVVRTDPALAHFFARPGVAAIAKRRTADEIAQRLGVGKLVRDFLGLVAAHGRGDILPEIGEAYRARVDADLNRARARVRAAVPLSDSERTALAARLGEALGGKHVAVDAVVDKNLLGGFVAEIGSVIV